MTETEGALLAAMPANHKPPKKPRQSIHRLERSAPVLAKIPGGLATCALCNARDSCLRASAFGAVDDTILTGSGNSWGSSSGE